MIDNGFVEAFFSLLGESEFWSAIAGAVVGGLIALLVQLINLRASKKQREEDRLYVQRALANGLLFKVVRIHSNLFGIHNHVETCYELGRSKGDETHPWRFFMPLANPPEPVSFLADEMGMLIAQKDNDVFNSIMDMDVAHNSLIEMVKLITVKRKDLTGRLPVSGVEGSTLSGLLTPDQMLALQPMMIEVNSLIEGVRAHAARDYRRSLEALEPLATLLKAKLGLTYQVQPLKILERATS